MLAAAAVVEWWAAAAPPAQGARAQLVLSGWVVGSQRRCGSRQSQRAPHPRRRGTGAGGRRRCAPSLVMSHARRIAGAREPGAGSGLRFSTCGRCRGEASEQRAEEVGAEADARANGLPLGSGAAAARGGDARASLYAVRVIACVGEHFELEMRCMAVYGCVGMPESCCMWRVCCRRDGAGRDRAPPASYARERGAPRGSCLWESPGRSKGKSSSVQTVQRPVRLTAAPALVPARERGNTQRTAAAAAAAPERSRPAPPQPQPGQRRRSGAAADPGGLAPPTGARSTPGRRPVDQPQDGGGGPGL